jgi:ribosomal protein S18 acetylase RimI-like enzyme
MTNHPTNGLKTFHTSDFTNKKKRLQKEIYVEDSPFQDTAAEFDEMRNLLIKSYRFNKNFGSWMVTRLENWKFGTNMLKAKTDAGFLKNKARLWRNKKKELIGFCIQEFENSGIHIQPRPGDLFLIPLMVDWIVSDWGVNKGTIETYSIDEDFYTYELLMVAGFKNLGDSEIIREYDTALKRDQKPLKTGFTIRNFETYLNHESLLNTINTTCELKEKLNCEWLESKLSSPSISNEWQLSVVNSDGESVGFCFVLIDDDNKIAEIDTIGVHPDYQKNGFARHLIIECFDRLASEGINSCYITAKPDTYALNYLCESLIPDSIKKYHLWRKT